MSKDPEELRDIFMEGYDTYTNGEDKNNPYESQTKEYAYWDAGYEKAEQLEPPYND